ncbi:MAG: DNA polymerase III subunit delta [Candidatus Uhrbacteria bacterium]
MVIFLHGDDTFRSREKLRALKERFLKEVDPSGSNLVILDGAKASASDIWGAIAAQSFLVRKRMVVIEEAARQRSAQDETVTLLNKIPDDVIVVFWESTSCAKPKKADVLVKHLLKEKLAQEFTPLTSAALERWANAYAKGCGTSFEHGACRELCAVVGANLWRMSREIEKLRDAASQNPPPLPDGGAGQITTQLIRVHVDVATHDDIFAFVDALGRGDMRASLAELRKLESTSADPQYLVTMIARQLRLLAMTADCIERGTPHADIATIIGTHPFVTKKLIAQARNTSLTKLRALAPKLLELDRKLKSSKAPRQALLELFCIEATS